MTAQEDKPLKLRLAEAGYEVRKVDGDGYCGVKIYKDGNPVGNTPRDCFDSALDIVTRDGF